MAQKLPVITLDGPAGVGKSTLAKAVSEELGLPYLNTGAMFRALALRLGADALHLPDQTLREQCTSFDFALESSGKATVLRCNGSILGAELHTEEVAGLASQFATRPPIREALKAAQRKLAQKPLVAEGRDMGTEVFPDARFKFFIDASVEVRAKRRYAELKTAGENVDFASIQHDIALRDAKDRQRAVAPLRPAEDAQLLDTTALTVQEALNHILTAIEQNGGI